MCWREATFIFPISWSVQNKHKFFCDVCSCTRYAVMWKTNWRCSLLVLGNASVILFFLVGGGGPWAFIHTVPHKDLYIENMLIFFLDFCLVRLVQDLTWYLHISPDNVKVNVCFSVYIMLVSAVCVYCDFSTQHSS